MAVTKGTKVKHLLPFPSSHFGNVLVNICSPSKSTFCFSLCFLEIRSLGPQSVLLLHLSLLGVPLYLLDL